MLRRRPFFTFCIIADKITRQIADQSDIKYGAAAGIFRFGVVAAEVAVDIADLRNVDNGAAGRSRHAGFNAVVYGSVAVKAAVDAADDRVGRV